MSKKVVNIGHRKKKKWPLAISVGAVICLSVGLYFGVLIGVKGGLIFFFGG